MRMLHCVLVFLVLAAGMVYGQTACLQDQYGNQYNFTVDKTDSYLYGTVTSTQGCGTWPITGSYVVSTTGTGLEITAANVVSASSCVPMYTVKGAMPNFNWYYDFGPSPNPQPGTWVACGTSITEKPTGKGQLK